jgi:hypothetical protein
VPDDPAPLDLVSGEPAARRVATDPFWSTVVRRHPDVDVVVLPPEPSGTPDVPADGPTADPAVARQDFRDRMAALWSALGLAGEPSHLGDTWFAGAADGTLRWQGTATFDDLDPVVASGVLGRAQDVLAEAGGWHALAPPEGIPRVLAGRPGRLGRDEIQVLVPTASRVVLRIRSEPVVVGADAAAEALGGDER